ncbi:GNAT family N-acetyltransferase [Miniphocaeibacter massiliensis]|uniref:GNAT family N-acetyltransferase n=1 Tax=Miniphocaeibacter massiliensis TaxID=2041841 RepID=UPI000C1BA19C|nr:GNAT family N-acetyltransferase [Miniphocaeibacter massiliensis]
MNSLVEFVNVNKENISEFYKIQKICFKDLYNKYNDDGNPYKESLEGLINKLSRNNNYLYLIYLRNELVGGVRIVTDNRIGRIAPMFVLPKYQNKGIGKQILLKIESLYNSIEHWELDTIKEENKLVKFYKSLGYLETGKEKFINENMNIVYLEKINNKKSS